MADRVAADAIVARGTYRCAACGNEFQVQRTQHMPPCPECGSAEWYARREAHARDSAT